MKYFTEIRIRHHFFLPPKIAPSTIPPRIAPIAIPNIPNITDIIDSPILYPIIPPAKPPNNEPREANAQP